MIQAEKKKIEPASDVDRSSNNRSFSEFASKKIVVEKRIDLRKRTHEPEEPQPAEREKKKSRSPRRAMADLYEFTAEAVALEGAVAAALADATDDAEDLLRPDRLLPQSVPFDGGSTPRVSLLLEVARAKRGAEDEDQAEETKRRNPKKPHTNDTQSRLAEKRKDGEGDNHGPGN
jgi:hypothetical protein